MMHNGIFRRSTQAKRAGSSRNTNKGGKKIKSANWFYEVHFLWPHLQKQKKKKNRMKERKQLGISDGRLIFTSFFSS
ncbi:60S ribosomal protein L31E [Histoplasma capsulatum G186AR]|uniref:60S ribosomal protein L31E n=1 Tax=Ajellomyces capsulatus TaxID=5037 RepID=A0A8H8D8D0_AJECA|nr:60S ribosomal protein L31E [Histoplasma capsulatum]QSS69035.1 60S ribosomal protein L31E [Histoplasma capsulatum G186AR]